MSYCTAKLSRLGPVSEYALREHGEGYEPNDKQILHSHVFRCKNKRRIGQYLLLLTDTSGLVFENRPIVAEPHAGSEKCRAIVRLLAFFSGQLLTIRAH
jgi:hypothetical protein